MKKQKRETRGRKPGVVSEAQQRTAAAMHSKGYVSPEEAAEIACVARSTMYSWVRKGVLTQVQRVHGMVWISRAELAPLGLAAVPKAG